MTVLENVMAARHLRSRQMLADAVLGTGRHHAEERETRERAMELLKIFDLDRVADEPATSLPYGSQRRLEIARALATEPKLLLLDEPAAGMNPQEALDLMRLIRWLRDEFQLTILLVEHNMKVVMGICETIQVIDYGEAIAIGTPARDSAEPEGDRGVPGRRLATSMLTLENVNVFYGAIHALRDVSLTVNAGEVVTLIGANGAGKSTTLRAITGLLTPQKRTRAVRGRGHHRRAGAPARRARHLDGAGGPRHLREPDRARESRDGRLPQARPRRRSSRISSAASRCFRASRSA